MVGSRMVVGLSASRTGRALLPRNIFSASGAQFCWRLSGLQGLVRPRVLGTFKKEFNNLIGNQTSDLLACAMVPQPLSYSVPLKDVAY
jgi:hypothetical protein